MHWRKVDLSLYYEQSQVPAAMASRRAVSPSAKWLRIRVFFERLTSYSEWNSRRSPHLEWRAAKMAVGAEKRIPMPSPFPGMDPYLENPEIFPDFHDSLITYFREALQASLPAPYFAALGRRVWIELARRSVGPDVQIHRAKAGIASPRPKFASPFAVAAAPVARPVTVKIAHDEFREPFVEIYTRGDEGKRLVTSIEVLSLSNKTAGEQGRDLYLRKQKEILSSKVNLVEIDLLRGGQHVTAVPLQAALSECEAFDYHASIHCFDDQETFFVYPIHLEERLPPIAIPLLPGDSPVTVDLQSVFNRCYDAGPYAREIHYGVDAVLPALSADQAVWAAELTEAGQNGE